MDLRSGVSSFRLSVGLWDLRFEGVYRLRVYGIGVWEVGFRGEG